MTRPASLHGSGGSLVEILGVSVSEGDHDDLSGCFLDQPTAGGPASASDTYALDIRGWVVGRRHGAVAVELVHEEACLWHLPLYQLEHVAAVHPGSPNAASSGFFGTVNTFRLPPEFTIVVRAVLEDDGRVEFATIRGRRALVRSSFEPRLQPLMITTLGRTGSTMLVRSLGAHPGVVACPAFDYEPRVASYWLGILLALSEPASYRRQLSPGPAAGLDTSWWLGKATPLPRVIRPAALQEWIGVTSLETLTAFCQERIEALYEQIASELDVRSPAYFAEKYWAASEVPSFVWELFPRAREVVVVRDFRDMLCSMYAFDEKRGFRGFGRQRAASDEDHVEQLEARVASLLRGWQERAGRAHLVRYEDLVARPSETLEGLLKYLELDSTPPVVGSMIEAMVEVTPEMEAHRTTLDTESSVGRWRRELSADTKRACETAFGPALEAFGYPLGEHDTATH